MSNQVEEFLKPSDEQDVIEAIRIAELNTSGEIRVHIEKTSGGNCTNRALEVFYMLKMDNTKLQNAVLIYVAVQEKNFVIYGDKGINDAVGKTFWDSTKNVMQAHFKAGNFKQGLVEGVLKSGEQLKKFFPYKDSDVDELSNQISKS